MLAHLLLWLALLPTAFNPAPTVPREGMGSTLSYRSLTSAEKSLAFYRAGGHGYENQRVHLHVPAARLLGKPTRIVRTPTGGKLYVFENQSVPLVVDPNDVYFRKIKDRAAHGDRLCLKGIVRREPKGGKDRLALYLHKIKRAHDQTAKKAPKKR